MQSCPYLGIDNLGGEGDRVLASETLNNTSGLCAAGRVCRDLNRALPEAAKEIIYTVMIMIFKS
jgi:hypothetical protein